MKSDLKEEISGILEALDKSGKRRLAGCIRQNWRKTAIAYSKELNFYKPEGRVEKEMLDAFRTELERLGFKKGETEKILSSIGRRMILQTAPHLGATESPRMLCINWLASLGAPKSEYCIVAMFSGIPFSNRSRPGRINRKKDSINLLPATMQDALAYRSAIPAKIVEVASKLPEEIKKFLPKAEIGGSYTRWALNTCRGIEQKILKRENLIYLDINEVVSKYLAEVLKNKNHIFYKIFFDPKTRGEFAAIFPDEIIFYAPDRGEKYERMENFFFRGNKLRSKTREIPLDSPEILIRELEEERLCPALLIGFTALAFINHFKCFGSFAQAEYLPAYQEKISRLEFMRVFETEKVPTANLTTGMFPAGSNYPADIIMGEKFKPDRKTLFGEILTPMKNILLESYFTGNARKNKK